MALINCPECNNQVSDMANSCPHCGWVVSKNNTIVNKEKSLRNSKINIKKSIKKINIRFVIIAVVAIILLAGIILGVLYYKNVVIYSKGVSYIEREIDAIDETLKSIDPKTTYAADTAYYEYVNAVENHLNNIKDESDKLDNSYASTNMFSNSRDNAILKVGGHVGWSSYKNSTVSPYFKNYSASITANNLVNDKIFDFSSVDKTIYNRCSELTRKNHGAGIIYNIDIYNLSKVNTQKASSEKDKILRSTITGTNLSMKGTYYLWIVEYHHRSDSLKYYAAFVVNVSPYVSVEYVGSTSEKKWNGKDVRLDSDIAAMFIEAAEKFATFETSYK